MMKSSAYNSKREAVVAFFFRGGFANELEDASTWSFPNEAEDGTKRLAKRGIFAKATM